MAGIHGEVQIRAFVLLLSNCLSCAAQPLVDSCFDCDGVQYELCRGISEMHFGTGPRITGLGWGWGGC